MNDREDMAAPRPIDDVGGSPPRRSRLSWVFFGSDGLRAGWSLLLFAALLAAIVVAAQLVVTAIHPPHPHKGPPAPQAPMFLIINELLVFTACALAAFIVSRVERRPFARYGLCREHAVRDLLHGFGWGVVMLSVLVGLLAATGALVFDGFALSGVAAIEYAAEWFVGFSLVGLFEEFFTRGFLQYTLARGVAGIVRAVAPGNRHGRTIGFWVAAAVFSVGIFAAGHLANKGETAMGIVGVALAGVTFVYVLYRTGSLWWAIGFHATWDWAQSFLYGVRDSGTAVQGHLLNAHPAGATLLSGGDTGPEGSILIVPVLAATIALIHYTLPRRATAFDARQGGDGSAEA